MSAGVEVTVEQARRLAVVKQMLGARRPKPTPSGMKETLRAIRCLQIDPINTIDHTQHLVLWSRVGNFDRSAFNKLVFEEKFLFHYWAHAASLVLTEDLPIHRMRMRQAIDTDTAYGRRIQSWIGDNRASTTRILRELRRRGPLRTRDLSRDGVSAWKSSGWNDGQTITRALEYLWLTGKVTIAGRQGLERVWDLTERWLPHPPGRALSTKRAVERAAEISLGCLGVATMRQIKEHFTRGAYPGLASALETLVGRGTVRIVHLTSDGRALKGPWYALAEDLETLERLDHRSTPRTTLLSPFDNLICDRARTESLWDFHYRIEIYVPKNQRRFGYYVMPILHRDRLIGRIDSRVDRARSVLAVGGVHLERDGAADPAAPGAVRAALEELAVFVGAGLEVRSAGVPKAWRGSLV